MTSTSTAYPGSSTDSVPRGPKRWERAARNAALRPNSKAAKLYLARVAVAREVGECYDSYSKAHYQYSMDWRTHEKQWELKYFTCSTVHAAMQLALDAQTTDMNTLSGRFFWAAPDFPSSRWEDRCTGDSVWVSALQTTPDRDARCQVCGVTIHPDGTLESIKRYSVMPEDWNFDFQLPKLEELMNETPVFESPAPVVKKVLYTLNDFGELAPVAWPIRVVELTDDEFAMTEFMDQDAVEALLEKRGRELGEVS